MLKKSRAALWLLAFTMVACVGGEPDVDFGTPSDPDRDADNVGNNDGGVRVLSDATPPNARDASKMESGASAGDSGSGAEGTLGPTDGAGDGRERDIVGDIGDRDAGIEGGRPGDGAADAEVHNADARNERDASSDPTIDVRTPSADITSDLVVSRGDAADRDDVPEDAVDWDKAADRSAPPSDALDLDDADAGDDAEVVAPDAPPDGPPPAAHLLISEIVTRPAAAEMIEIFNPTDLSVDLSGYLLSDSHLYYEIARGAFVTASGSDFAARFPDGLALGPRQYAVVALGNASGGTQSFLATYGKAPDFELRPTANQAVDDPAVANMVAVGTTIGASASLTDSGEPVVLFAYRDGDLVTDVDYVFYGAATASNPVVDKTNIVVGASVYRADTPPAMQRAAPLPGETGSLHRCGDSEAQETTGAGNGMEGHDETSEDVAAAFFLGAQLADRTPGGPPPANVCGR